MMDRIYLSAVYVIAWLGPPDEHSDLGIKTLNTLHSHLKQFKESDIEHSVARARTSTKR
jgi:hypothetical protein